jgi:acetyl esterase/lipase
MELLGRYEENAYMARMMKIAGHEQTTLHELQGYGHGMAEPAHPLLIQFVREISVKKRETMGRAWKDVDYVGDGITAHLLDIFLPGTENGPFPVVMYIYGSAWFSNNGKGSVEVFKKQLLDAGFAVVAINHRSSREAIFPAQIHDVKAAVRFIRANAGAYHLDPGRIGVTGASSGGHLSSFLGTSGGVKRHSFGDITVDLEGSLGIHLESSSSVMAVVDWFGPTDFLSMNSCGSEMDHDEPDSPESSLIGAPIQENPGKCALANPVTYIDKIDPPFLIFHGNKDPLVPFCQSELLHKRLTEAGVSSTFIQISDAGHGPGLLEAEHIQKMVWFFEKHLK